MKERNFDYNPETDIAEVEEIPEYEYNVERMLVEGTIGSCPAEEAYNNMDIDEVGNRIEDGFEAVDRLRKLRSQINN